MNIEQILNHIIDLNNKDIIYNTIYKNTNEINSYDIGKFMIYMIPDSGNEYIQFEVDHKNICWVYTLYDNYFEMNTFPTTDYTTNLYEELQINYSCTKEEFFQKTTVANVGWLKLSTIKKFEKIQEMYSRN